MKNGQLLILQAISHIN